MLYTIHFKIRCPFDPLGTLPPQDSEIRCSTSPDRPPVFSPVNFCDCCTGLNYNSCQKCAAALRLMFQQGLIPLQFHPSCPVRTLPDPIRPSLALLSK